MEVINMNRLRTPAQAKLWLQNHGISVQAFALAHDLDAATCYQVLDGRKKGLRGKAHQAAVALGIKPDLSNEDLPQCVSGPNLSKPTVMH
jgi:gp16 family phage-associated protein